MLFEQRFHRASAAALIADLRGPVDLPTYRIGFHHAGGDPRLTLSLAVGYELSPRGRAFLGAGVEEAVPGR